MTKIINTYFSSILNNHRKRKAFDVFRLLVIDMFAINTIYFLVCLLLETIWYLSPDLKIVLWYGLFFNAYFLFRFFSIGISLVSKQRKEEKEDLLLYIGRQFPEVEDRLLNHFQLSEHQDEISKAATQGFIQKFPPEYFIDSYKNKPRAGKLRFALISISILIVFSLFSFSALKRFYHFRRTYNPPNLYQLEVSPQNIVLYSYDTLELYIKKYAPDHFPVEIMKYNEDTGISERLYRSRDSLINYSAGRVKYSALYLVRIQRPNIFYPRKYPDTDTVRVTVLQRPRIRSMDFTVLSPPYTGIQDAYFQGNIDRINVLRGSEIQLRIRLSEPFGTSYLINGSDTLFFQIDQNEAEMLWRPIKSEKIILKLYNFKGIGVENDPSYLIDIDEDEFPRLEILSPKISDEILLNEDMIVPYIAQLRDDFGISSFKVLYTVHSEYSFSPDTAVKRIDLPFAKDASLQTRVGTWEIREFISPGSELRYYFELRDNDIISGPKTVRSQMFYAALPSLSDLFERQDEAREESMAMLEDELISTEEMIEDLDKVREELLREGEMKWENKSALEENLKTLEQAKEELSKIQTSMDEQQEFMKENALFSDKVMQDFEQLQELMNELIDDEMFDMIRDIQDKLQKNDTGDMEQILEDFSEKVKRFEESLERMLDIFKRIEQQQRLEELGSKIKESLKEQLELTEDADKVTSEDLAERQEKIAAETKDWEELSKESSELFDGENKDLFEEFIEEMNNEAVSNMMEMASESYGQNDKSGGRQQSEQSSQKLQTLDRSFSEMASAMMKKQKDDVSNGFQKAFLQTLYLSHEHEKLLNEGKDLTNSSPLVHRYTRRMYDNLQLVLEINKGLLELSKKTFFVDRTIGITLGNIIGGLRSGIKNAEEANLSQGQKDFNNSFKNMNRLARMLLDRMNMVQEEQQGNASGLEFYMQQLQQMAGDQQKLNSGMPQLGMQGSPGNSMMDQMARMAARQQALRRKLKQIQQGMSEGEGGKRVTGNLDKIAKDMEEVINQMRKNQVDRQTIMRQEKIVQRLLDASRSATSRDYKKERESVTGKELLRDNPLSLPGDLGEHRSLINIIRREVQNSDLTPQEKREMEKYLESLLGTEIYRGEE